MIILENLVATERTTFKTKELSLETEKFESTKENEI